MTQNAAVILDVDGTLVDSNDAHAHAWVDAFAEAGIAVAFEHVRRSIGMGGDKLMPLVSRIEEDSALGGRIAARRAAIFKETYLPRILAFPGTRALIERLLAEGFVLAVASSAKDDELDPLLERAGVHDLLTRRTSSDDADHSKPDPDIVLAALKETRCDPERVLMLGDTPYDVAAAKRAGIEIVGLECGGWTREALAGAIAVYRDPADLLANYIRSPFTSLLKSTT
ncbi:MAG TPA: HAD family hydrolase [Vicinamibacterales bacterium]